MTSSWRRNADEALPARGKIVGGYVNMAFQKSEAELNGFDEALVLTAGGHASEASAANLFMVRDGVVVTPPVYDDILEGITRKAMLQLATDAGLATEVRSIDRSELYIADEVFLCGTGVQVSPVVEVDHRPVGSGEVGPVAGRASARATSTRCAAGCPSTGAGSPRSTDGSAARRVRPRATVAGTRRSAPLVLARSWQISPAVMLSTKRRAGFVSGYHRGVVSGAKPAARERVSSRVASPVCDRWHSGTDPAPGHGVGRARDARAASPGARRGAGPTLWRRWGRQVGGRAAGRDDDVDPCRRVVRERGLHAEEPLEVGDRRRGVRLRAVVDDDLRLR